MEIVENIEAFAEYRDQIDLIVDDARLKLVADYAAAQSLRFPFGQHHTVARRRIREPVTRKHPRNADVARLLVEWATEHGGPEIYVWQSIALAIEDICPQPRTATAEHLLAEARDRLLQAPVFVEWAQTRLQTAHHERMHQFSNDPVA